ncbi:MAG TPA: hypothetical protein VG826_12080 [Pirellulales bacterium]|nr:hypothetical protein [Pirellulales bacterium]
MKWSVAWALALVVVGSALLHAAPRSKSGKGQNANAKTVDVMKAVTDKQVDAQVALRGATATLTVTNLSQEPLNVKVPLAIGALPQVPEGANQAYYAATFGAPSAPQPLVVAVSPLGAAGVDKRARKTGVKTNKKKAGDDKEEKKDDDKDAKGADEKKETDSLEASLLLLPGLSQSLPVFTLSLDAKKIQASYGPFTLTELDKVSESSEMKSLLEKVSQNVVPRNVAQTLAWHYHGRLSWDEMAKDGLGTLTDLEVAKQYAEVVEGRASATPAVAAGKKRKRASSDE